MGMCMNHYHLARRNIFFWGKKNRAEGKDCGGREIYERMVIQRQAAAPYLSHYAEQIRWLRWRSVAAVLIKMGTNSKGERI